MINNKSCFEYSCVCLCFFFFKSLNRNYQYMFESMHVFYRLLIYELPLKWQLSKGEGCGPINRFNSATMLCLSQARTLISNVICRGLFEVYWVQVRWEMIVRFVYIGWIDDSDYAHIWTKISTREGNPNVDQLLCHSFVTHHEIMPTFEPRSIPEGAWPNHDQLSCHSF